MMKFTALGCLEPSVMFELPSWLTTTGAAPPQMEESPPTTESPDGQDCPRKAELLKKPAFPGIRDQNVGFN